MKISTRTILIKLSLLSAMLFSGCGKDKPPDPPLMRSKTVLDTYKSLENREHKISLMKIQRLRDIDPSNVFLANLEVLEKTNSVISDVQAKVDKGDFEGALTVASNGKRKYGAHKDIVETENKLKVFKKIAEILDVFRTPRDSSELKIAANQLKKLGQKYKTAAIYVPLSEKKIAEAELMNRWEIKRAVSSLCSHINDLLIENDSDVELLFAVLEIADPLNPMLMNYMENLNGANADLIIYPEENIFADPDEDKTDEEKEDKEKPEEKPEAEKKGSWWDKFSF